MVILVRKAEERLSFASQATFGFIMRVDLRRDMIKDRSIRAILPKRRKTGCQDHIIILRRQGAKRGQPSPARGIR